MAITALKGNFRILCSYIVVIAFNHAYIKLPSPFNVINKKIIKPENTQNHPEKKEYQAGFYSDLDSPSFSPCPSILGIKKTYR